MYFRPLTRSSRVRRSSKVLRRQAFISWMCLFDHIWAKYRTRPYLIFWKGWSRPLPSIRSKSATAAPRRRLQKRRQHSRQRPMCNSKTKTALPVGAGKAVIETGIVCVDLSRPYNSTEQSVWPELFLAGDDKSAHGLAGWLGCAPYILL